MGESHVTLSRRAVLGLTAAPAASLSAAGASLIAIEPRPLFEISPLFYMQFFEPLGVTDTCAEAAWDYDADDWRKDFVEATGDLAPDVIRFGGIYSRYYKWREGVGAASQRPSHRNYAWGGKETNRIGTHELVTLCRRVGAEPLFCVNFLGDGVQRYRHTPEGDRTGDAQEAADWVSYANDPDHRERRAHGAEAPYNIRLWQLGNETSYGTECFTKDHCIRHTIEFARAMRARDKSIRLIGWGDKGRGGGSDGAPWATDLLKRAGEHLDFVAFHMMGMRPQRKDTVLAGLRYQQRPEEAWQELIELARVAATRLQEIEQAIRMANARTPIAITEGHLSLSPHNSNPILAEWLSAAYHAKTLNLYLRHGEWVKIATAADFPAQRWTVGSLMLPVPRGQSYLMPVGSIMRLFKRHHGTHGVQVTSAPADLDIAASRTGERVYLHVLNQNFRSSVAVRFSVAGATINGGRVFEIAPEDPRAYVDRDHTNTFTPQEKAFAGDEWRFPARSVSVVELTPRGMLGLCWPFTSPAAG